MKNIILLIVLSFLYTASIFGQKQYSLQSPDGKLKVDITVGKNIMYSVQHSGDILINKSPLSVQLTDGTILGVNSKLIASKSISIKQNITSPVYKRSVIKDHYNELLLRFKGDYYLVFRAYDDGVAYRFETKFKAPFVVENEQVAYNFPSDYRAFVPYVRGKHASKEAQYSNSFESLYNHIRLSEWDKNKLAFSPLVVEAAGGKKICLVEADLFNYPGMFLHNADTSTNLTGVFAACPEDIEYGGHNNLQGIVKSRGKFIAKCKPETVFPWRVMIVAEQDKDLADSDMVYKLASPSKLDDVSWIKPGKVAWDWWNDWNLCGVDFETGVNNETYKYYIDFASSKGIEYVILDEGWAVNLKADLMQVVPEINLEELVVYAKNKNVDLILWAGYYAFDRDMESICRHYSEIGIKGFKIDFMDRDDQYMVNFHTRAAETAAKYKLLVDFHGTYKPTGLQRTYPNVINFEGVHGLEQMKWSEIDIDQVTYDVTMPFIRMVAGPVDYTQGAMRNANKTNYRAINTEAMSQGTRCRQLAQYVIFESPLNMLCDSPTNYLREKECTDFIASVPTTWDNTVALNGKISEYISIARQKGNDWYVGSLTNWDKRSLQLDLSFLGEGRFKADVFRDGINADKASSDYKKETIDIPSDRKLTISMASGGGYVMHIYKSTN